MGASAMRELLQLESGGVLRLSRSAGENIDILVGNRVIGFGEIVIIEDALGILRKKKRA